ncbi:MAG: hypothetical protein ACI92E_000922 [Oceanicoccus sp.]
MECPLCFDFAQYRQGILIDTARTLVFVLPNTHIISSRKRQDNPGTHYERSNAGQMPANQHDRMELYILYCAYIHPSKTPLTGKTLVLQEYFLPRLTTTSR